MTGTFYETVQRTELIFKTIQDVLLHISVTFFLSFIL